MPIAPYWVPLETVTAKTWRDVAAKKKLAQLECIPAEWRIKPEEFKDLLDVTGVPRKFLSAKELEITEIDDAYQLRDLIWDKTYSAVEVATAFCHRAAIAHQLTNCLTEIFFPRALAAAAELDAYLAANGKPKGPLHGLPISLKDQFDIEGIECTIAYAGYLGRISTESCALVKLLEDAGAVLYLRPDTVSHVFGATTNPTNRNLSAGGSSGGEGALVAMKGSIIGLGTDIGGSVRIPAAMCGIVTLKPSMHRIPYGKATNSMLGQITIASVIGPMTRSVESCKLFLDAVCEMGAADYDATAIPLPFDNALFDKISKKEKLAFGYLIGDGTVTPAPPLARALLETVEKLKAAGHEVIQLDEKKYIRAGEVAGEVFGADGLEDIDSILGPMGEEPLHVLGASGKAMTVYENWQLNREKEFLQQQFLADWDATAKVTKSGLAIDAVLSIAVPVPACVPGDLRWCGTTGMFNTLDLPCTVIPVSTVDAKIDQKPAADQFEALSHWDQDSFDKYDADVCDGMPVTLQIVGRRWKEEGVLAASIRVQEVLAAAK